QQQKINMSYVVMILFFSLYYFFNAQRGIVRHSFIEGTDAFISSFVFLIVPLFVGYLLVQKSKVIWFMGIATMLVMFTKYNEIESYKSNMSSVVENMQQRTPNPMNLVSKNTRIEEDNSFNENQYFALKKMIGTKFSDSSTYIDFSNSPMLYYYLQRRIPSVFNQYMQNTVSPYQQKENIRHLPAFDIPFVVFSNYPASWFDESDGVPNPLRYYHTVNYIYNNFKPWGISGKSYLWIRKDITIGNDVLPVDSDFVYSPKHWNIQKLAYLLGNTKEEFISKEIKIEQRNIAVISDSTVSIELPKVINKTNGNWLVVEIENIDGSVSDLSVNCEVLAGITSDSFVFESKNEKGKSFYLLPVSSFYNWHIYDTEKIILKMPLKTYKLISVGYTESL
ncbi:MAG TPA: hypothetical protein VNW06_10415, partial [Cytophagaceae bacterium]|nr:hypothetical protein [Cytophagaceae bacterium]